MKKLSACDRACLVVLMLVGIAGVLLAAQEANAAVSGSPCKLVKRVRFTPLPPVVAFGCIQVSACDEGSCGVADWPPDPEPSTSGDILCWCPLGAIDTSDCDLADHSWSRDEFGNLTLVSPTGCEEDCLSGDCEYDVSVVIDGEEEWTQSFCDGC